MVTGKKAIIQYKDMQPGDAERTYADISKANRLISYQPATSTYDGLTLFNKWLLSNNKKVNF